MEVYGGIGDIWMYRERYMEYLWRYEGIQVIYGGIGVYAEI